MTTNLERWFIFVVVVVLVVVYFYCQFQFTSLDVPFECFVFDVFVDLLGALFQDFKLVIFLSFGLYFFLDFVLTNFCQRVRKNFLYVKLQKSPFKKVPIKWMKRFYFFILKLDLYVLNLELIFDVTLSFLITDLKPNLSVLDYILITINIKFQANLFIFFFIFKYLSKLINWLDLIKHKNKT